MKRKLVYAFVMLLAAGPLQAQETDLSARGTANCYVITAPGRYAFDASAAGGSSRPVVGGVRAGVLWSDAPGVVRDVELRPSCRIAFTADSVCGNAVLVLLDSVGAVCWSWHVWHPETPPADEWYVSSAGVNCLISDRPLGAVAADGRHPLFYQWGRKDPFPSGDEVYAAGTERVAFLTRWPPVPGAVAPDSTVKRPATFVAGGNWCSWSRDRLHGLWGDASGYLPAYRTGGGWSGEKSPYDPCPAGYRVANSNAFSGFTSTGRGSDKPSEWNVTGPWSGGWRMRRTAADTVGTPYAVTGWRDGATGALAGETRGVLWCSNPSGFGSDAMRRLFYHERVLLTVSREQTAMAYPVRCVREDDAGTVYLAAETPPAVREGPCEDLSASGTANCYVVTRPGNYRFRATVRGGGKRPVGRCASASLLWADRPGLLRNVVLDKEGYIRFSVFRRWGNAVVAVRDAAGRILWSWHVWCAGERPADKTVRNHDGALYEVMDRNLGAFSALPGETGCMLYQWGRKDPFPCETDVFPGEDAAVPASFSKRWRSVGCYETGDDKRHNNLEYAIRNPATFITGDERSGNWFPYEEESSKYLWGDPLGYDAQYRNGGWSDAKSVYDPCPAGYRVANVNAFSGFTATGRGSDDASEFRTLGPWGHGWWFRSAPGDGQGIWFPVTGWRDKRTGDPGGGTRGALWCSNPTGSAGTQWRRIFFHEGAVLVASKEGSAQAYAVRCVRE